MWQAQQGRRVANECGGNCASRRPARRSGCDLKPDRDGGLHAGRSGSGATVTCSGVPALPLFLNTFSSAANNLTVNVNFGAQLNATLGGQVFNLSGNNITLNNAGVIDPALLVAVSVLSGGALIGNGGASTVNITNLATGTMNGTASLLGLDLLTLQGMALNVNNGAGGITRIVNNGVIGSRALVGLSLLAADVPVVAVGGGSRVDMVNTGTITGRVAFEASAGGNTFTNLGTLSGGVSMGAGSTNTFTAITGSTVDSGGGIGLSLGGLIGVNLAFAPTGQIDGGAGGTNALVLQNTVGVGGGTLGVGTVSSANYVNFSGLTVESGTWTLQGALVSGSTTLNGGIAQFNDSLSFGPGVLTANGGAIQATAGGLSLANAITLNGLGLQVLGGNGFTLAGSISGTGGLVKSGAGTLTVNGANTYSGGTALNSGVLAIGNPGALGTGTLSVGGASTLATGSGTTLNNNIALNANLTVTGTGLSTLCGVVGGSGGLIKTGTGTLQLNGTNTYSGPTALNAGTLLLGSDTALGAGALNAANGTTLEVNTAVTLANAINLGGYLTLGGSATLALNGTVNGIGGLIKNGAADLTLSGTNAYLGNTSLNAGRLIVGASNALGQGSLNAAAGTTLDASSAATLGNAVNLAGAFTVGGSSDLALNGSVNGVGSLVKNGAARLTLNGPNGFLGGTTLSAGTLAVGNASALGLGNLTVAGAATLDSSAPVAVSNSIVLNAALTVAGNNDLALGGIVSGGGALIKSGLADLTLSGTNTLTGPLSIRAGSVTTGSLGALGAISGVSIDAGAALLLGADAAVQTLAGPGDVAIGAGRTLSVGGTNASSTFDGDLSGSGRLVKAGTGVLALSGINSLTGDTQVDAGTLNLSGSLGSANVLVASVGTLTGAGSLLGTLGVANGGSLSLASAQTLSAGSLVLGSGSNLQLALGAPSTTFLLNVGGNLTLGGTVNVTDAGGFGVGVYRLINYTGTLTNNGIAIGAVPASYTSSDLSLQTAVGNQVNLLVASPIGNIRFWNGTIASPNGTVNGGSGTWDAAGTSWTTSTGAQALGWNGDFAVFQGVSGQVTVVGPQSFTGLQFATDGYRLLEGAGAELTAVNGAGGAAAIRVDPNVTAIIDVPIAGSGTLTKLDSGTLVLNGASSYTGGTTLAGGTLSVASNSALGTGTLDAAGGTVLDSQAATVLANAVNLAGTLTVAGSNPLTLAGTVAGAGGLVKEGAADLTLAGSNGYLGGTALNAGRLIIGSDTALGTGVLVAADGTALVAGVAATLGNAVVLNGGFTVNAENSLVLGGIIGGTGGLVKTGTADLTLSGANTYAGGTALDAGRLVLGSATALGTGTLTTAGGTTLATNTALAIGNAVFLNGELTVGGSQDLTLAGDVSGTGGLLKTGTAQLVLAGSNSYAGATHVVGGTLLLGDATAMPQGSALSVDGGARFDLNGFAATVGSLAGNGDLLLGGQRLTVGGDDASTAFSGTLTGGAGSGLTKIGTGTLSLNGTATLAGTTEIRAGTVTIGNGQALGSGTVLLAGGNLLGTADLTMGAAPGDTIRFVGGVGNTSALAAAAGTQFRYTGTVLADNDVEVRFGSPTATGTVLLDTVAIVPGGGNTLRVAGGTLRAGNAQLGSLTAGALLLTTIDAGATLDFNGFGGGVAQLLGAGTLQTGSDPSQTLSIAAGEFAGLLQGAGTIRKTTVGSLVLSGNNSYSGATFVNAGTLRIDGDQTAATGAVTVADGATLTGAGKVGGAVTVLDGGRLAPGNGAGTLTTGALTINQNAQIDFQLGQAGSVGGALNDLVNVNGSLVLDGKLNVSTTAGGTFAPGLYRLFNYSGSLTDRTLDIATAPADVSALSIQTATAGQINLVNGTGANLRFWDAAPSTPGQQGGAGTWQGSAGNDNWTGTNGAANAPFAAGAFAVFQGAGGAVAVDSVTRGPINVQGMQFAGDGYALAGGTLQAAQAATFIRVGAGAAGASTVATIGSQIADDNVAGGTLLTKLDAGTLVLGGANTYRGGTTVNAGALRVSADNNLGAAGGGLTLDGGTLQYGAGFTSGRAVVLGAAGGTVDTRGNDAALAGAVSGAGALVKSGAGTLILSGSNSYSGGTLVGAGTLQGNTASLQGDIANNANVTFDQAAAGTYAGAMTGSGSLTKTGEGALILTSARNSYTGGTVIEKGMVWGNSDAFKGNIVNRASLGFDQAVDGIYASTIEGSGGLTKRGAGNLNLTGISGYTGATAVDGGTLSVNGSIANSAVSVNAGGVLGGTGTVGSTVVRAGGVFAPGNSIGTISVNGRLTFEAGSVYRVETDAAGLADRINVIGAPGIATLQGGTVDVRAGSGSYSPLTRYTIVNAVGGVNGTFASISSNLAFLTPTLAYAAANVYLSLARNDTGYASIGVTPNQVAVGTALQGTVPAAQGSALALLSAIDNLSAPQAQAAFGKLSGEIYASARTALVEDSRFVREAGLDRLNQAQGGAAAGNVGVQQQGQGTAVWARVFSSRGRIDGDGNASRLDRDISGFFAGADTALAGGWRAGGLLGYSKADLDIRALNASAENDSYHVGVYGGNQWGATSLRLGASYSWTKLDTRRSAAFTGFADSLKAKYDASTAQVFGEVGQKLQLGAFAFEPFAGLTYVNLDTKDFRERGGASALNGGGGSFDSTFGTLGLRASTALGETTRLRGMLGWRHAFGDRTPNSTAAFATGPSFSAAGVPLARNVAVIEAGVETQLQRNMTLSASYAGQVGSGMRDNGFRIGLG